MKSTSHQSIRAILDGLFDAYPRHHRLHDEAAAVWCLQLDHLPAKVLQSAAWEWVDKNKWPPDAVTKFKNFAASRHKGRNKEPDPPGWAEHVASRHKENPKGVYWCERQQTMVDVAGTPMPQHPDHRRTPEREARVHMRLIRDILDRRLRCPRSVAHHDIWAHEDREETWYRNEFRKRLG